MFFAFLSPLAAQSISLDSAIGRAANQLSTDLKAGSVVAIINFSSSSDALSSHVLDKLSAALVRDGKLRLAERARLDMILAEQEFQLSGNVSDESMQSIGHMLGAEYIITGSFTPAGTSCRFVINALSVESAQVQSVFIADVAEDPQIVFWLTGKKPIDPKAAKLWSAGVSVGTAFSEPWIILTARGTIAPIRYAFVELGFDVGLISGINKVRYYSLYPYGHLSFFLPLSNDFGWYAGAGGGYMMSSYRLDDIHETPASLMLDVNTGFNIWNYFDVSYTLRTNFNKMINKFSIGFVYRFK